MKFRRSSGILLHPTSLPGPIGSGDLGASAFAFIDWLASAGQSLWQMLPLGPAGMANSPYMSLSAFAGSPLFIDLDDLVSHGWLKKDDLISASMGATHCVDYGAVTTTRMTLLAKASKQFFRESHTKEHQFFDTYCIAESSWLEDYSLFQALNDKHGGKSWVSWEQNLVHRNPDTLKKAAEELKDRVDFHKFTQWCFARQWTKMKKYANDHDIKLIGDIPIFVAHHSADVWSNQDAFSLDHDGMPSVVAGVPPDYFSEDGQRWGNPLYRWDVMKQQKYRWWIERFRKTFKLFDILRIDHYRGFEAYWEIPAHEATARIGQWVKCPGENLFDSIEQELGTLPIIAEDLGVMTPEVKALRDKYSFPGMKVLQFAFSTDAEDSFLPHMYEKNYVVYTGTHDNDTTLGWYSKATAKEQDFVKRYCQSDGKDPQWDLIRVGLQSVADMAVIPLQDILGLDSAGRMNFPGTVDGNWEWRFTWDAIRPWMTKRLLEMTALYGRSHSVSLDFLSRK
jgi:4-alpha-glucanotransferase